MSRALTIDLGTNPFLELDSLNPDTLIIFRWAYGDIQENKANGHMAIDVQEWLNKVTEESKYYNDPILNFKSVEINFQIAAAGCS